MAAYQRPEEAEWPPWSGYLREAWSALQNDRSIGFGGIGGMWCASVIGYANIHGFENEDQGDFLRFMRILDSEYLSHYHEQTKIEAEKRRDK